MPSSLFTRPRPGPARRTSRGVAALTATVLAGLALTPLPARAGAVPVATPSAGHGSDHAPAVPAATRQGALDDGTRTTSFNDGWKFKLVNAADITDPTGVATGAEARPTTTPRGARCRVPHDWSIELDPTATGTTADAGLLPGRPGLVPQDLHAPEGPDGQGGLAWSSTGSTWTPHVYVNGELAATHPYGYTGFAGPADRHRAHRRQDPQRGRGEGAEQAPQQPVVLRQRHLPQHPPRGHRPGARGALGHPGDHPRPGRHRAGPGTATCARR